VYRTKCKRQGGYRQIFGTVLAAVLLVAGLSSCTSAAPTAGQGSTPSAAAPTEPITATQPVTQTQAGEIIQPTQPASPTIETSLPIGTMEPTSVPPQIVAQARQALADQLGVISTTLTLASSEVREWPDSSLGCPEAGQMYMQVITPGYLLVFADAAGTTYPVHTNETGQQLVLCRDEQPVTLGSGT
jgi:hypothetical protein